MRRGAIILCGGKSSRMGRDKALLPFGPSEVLLQRTVRLVSEAVPAERIVCVAAAEQQLPTLLPAVRVAVDPAPHQGPLAGLATGLRHLHRTADLVFLTGCDTPLLRPAVVGQMLDSLEAVSKPPGTGSFLRSPRSKNVPVPFRGAVSKLLRESFDLAAVHDGQHWYPLTAACRSRVLPQVESLLAAGERRLTALLEAGNARRIPLDELRRVDPELHSLVPCNTPAEYQTALHLAGLSRRLTT